ncbi:hypothetical protein [Streptomyces sp. 3211]|uniref:hypothetical protein n=1 Tax=Streptomyces sp. 3211 TaxID=1964449 RepID=UPI0013317BFD|nr:hypothetical protein [Streptomyces sp. 3211]
MSDDQTKSGGGAAKRKQDAGAFGSVRRRKAPASQANLAATLLQQAEEVADAGFMGNTAVLATPARGMAATEPAGAVGTASIAPPTASSSAAPLHETDLPGQQRTVASGADEPPESAPETVVGAESELESSVEMPEQTSSPVSGAASPTTSQRPRRAPRTSGRLGPTHQALHASFADSRTNSHDWASHGANLIPEVWDALRGRIARDRRSSSNSELAAGHYMDVVYRQAPMDAYALVTLYKKLSDQRLGYLGSGKKSTFRLGPEAKSNAFEIKALLDEADYARKGVYVVSALVILHLQTLESEGPLLKPDLPSLFS